MICYSQFFSCHYEHKKKPLSSKETDSLLYLGLNRNFNKFCIQKVKNSPNQVKKMLFFCQDKLCSYHKITNEEKNLGKQYKSFYFTEINLKT